jgi:hypothetical protein
MEPNDGIKGGSGGIIRRRLYKPLAVLAVLALSTMMCLSLGGTPSDETGSGPDVAATLAALQTELANAQATVEAAGNTQPPTLAPSDSTEPTEPPAAAAPGQKVEDTFDSDLGTFALGEGIQIQNGSLLLGPFEQCAEDVAAFDSPINCNAVCLTCGANLTNYRMQADISFADGLSDKQWGIILRFVDENGNGLLDREDYLMVIGFDVFDNAWAIFVHVPNAVSPWFHVKSGAAGLRGQNSPNRFEATASNNGRMIDVRLNDKRLVLLTADAPQPGETLIKDWVDSGSVGFVDLGRRVQARFDNFILEPLP